MTETKSTQQVVVTDVHMPFGSMVIFMVKWSIAAIPAVILLVIIGLGSAAIVSGVISSIRLTSLKSEQANLNAPNYQVHQSTSNQQPGFGSDVPDRCKGSTDLAKCIELERRLASETTEQKVQRRDTLEAERRANMEKVNRLQ